MISRATTGRLTALLGCLLVAAASGDDFCLPRLLFPFTPTGAEVLPLDDPNTDFVEAHDSAPSLRVERSCRRAPVGCRPLAPDPLPAGGLPATLALATARRAQRLPELIPPLRC